MPRRVGDDELAPVGGEEPGFYSFNYTDGEATATHFGIKLRFFENLNRVRPSLMAR